MKARAVLPGWMKTALVVVVGLFSAGCASANEAQRENCMKWAADHYHVDLDLLHAIAMQENGTVGRINRNRNGTYDISVMQINSDHLTELAPYGIGEEALRLNECLNITIGAWLLKRELVRAPSFWVGVGNYHSHTASLNVEYQWLIWRRLQEIYRRREYASS